MDSLPSQLLLQVFLILLNAVFASAEIAVISFNDMKLQKIADDGNKRARKLVRLTAEPTNFLGTIQVGITLAGFLGSAFAADNFSGAIVNALTAAGVAIPVSVMNTVSVVVITLVLSFFTLIFGELVPKRIAMKKAESLSLMLAGFLTVISKVCKPIVWLLTTTTNLVLKLIGINPTEEDEQVTEEEIRMMIDIGSQKGTIDPSEKTMIHNIFELDDTPLEDIMTHRTDIDFLWLDDDITVWEQAIADKNHTKYLVCQDTVDNIAGVLHIIDFYRALRADKTGEMRTILKPAYFVPDSMKADDLFKQMQQTKNHFACVLDEYGGLSGIVTMSDLLEEIVGRMPEEEDDVSEEIIQTGNNSWTIRGSTDLDTVAEKLGVVLPVDEYNTFAGMILGELNAIPEDGTTPELEAYGLHIRVDRIAEHRIETAVVQRLKPEETKPEIERSRVSLEK